MGLSMKQLGHKITPKIIKWFYKRGFTLTTLRGMTKVPRGKRWQHRCYTSVEAEISANTGNNLGCKLEKTDIVIDYDPRNMNGSGTFDDFLRVYNIHKDPRDIAPLVITGRHDGGFHLYFRLTKQQQQQATREHTKAFPGVTFLRGPGKQVLIPGCLHPDTHKLYQWDELVDPRDFKTIPTFPDNLFKIIDRSNDPKALYDSDQELISAEQLEDCLSWLDPEDFRDHETWFGIMCSSHHLTAGKGLEVFSHWSTSDPAYQEAGPIIKDRWQSLSVDKPEGITGATLYKHVLDAGGTLPDNTVSSEDFEDDEEKVVKNPPRDKHTRLFEQYVKDIETDKYVFNNLDSHMKKAIRKLPQSKALMVVQTLKKELKGHFPPKYIEDVYKTHYKAKEARDKERAQKKATDYPKLIAQRVVDDTFGEDNIVCAPTGQFYTYDSTHWIPVADNWIEGVIMSKATDLIANTKADFVSSAALTPSFKALRSLVSRFRASNDFFLPPQSIINTKNKELHIDPKSGKLRRRKHNPKSMLFACTQVTYDPAADSPRWDRALQEIFAEADDPDDLIRHLYEVFGYIMQPYKNIPSWFMFHGKGANGKTLVIEVLAAILGDDGCLPRRLESFEGRDTAHSSTALHGKLLVYDDDIKVGTVLPDDALKKLSEAKSFEANPKFKASYNFQSHASPVMLTNTYPYLTDVSHGMLRRAQVIPFERQFGADEQDIFLKQKIIDTELAGILNKSLEGLRRLRKRGNFDMPLDCTLALEDWIENANHIVTWTRTELLTLESGHCDLQVMYQHYRSWTLEQTSTKPKAKTVFATNLEHLGYRFKRTGGKLCVKNVCLVSEAGDKVTSDDF
jgi:P4 family phage/plasmid primase-like protien